MANSEINAFVNGFLILILSTLINISAAFFNQYPLLIPDSAWLIQTGMTYTLFVNHSIVYGLFIRVLSLGSSLWLVVFFQGFILTYVIYRFFYLLEIKKPERLTLIASITLSFFTGMSIYCSEISTDIFTPICILIIPILLLGHQSVYSYTLLGLILLLALMTDIYLAALFMIALVLFVIISFAFINEHFRVKVTKSLIIICLISLSILLIPTIHLFVGGKFYTAKSTQAFFMARMAESGVLHKFLEENCSNRYKLCEYKEAIPHNGDEFLWDSKSPIYKTDGWYDKDGEYKKIIKETFSTWRYLSLNIQESIKETFIQLFNFEVGDDLGNGHVNKLDNFFPSEYNGYLNSRQNSKLLNFSFLNQKQHFVLIISLISLVGLFFIQFLNQKLNYLQLQLTIFILISIVINAFIYGSLFGSHWHYQGRVIWLLPLLSLGLIVANFKEIENKIKNYFS